MPFGGEILRKLKNYKPTKFKAKDSYYDKEYADFAVAFIESLCHTKGTWAGKRFELMDWQEQIIRDLFGTLKPNGYRQFNTAYIEIPKKNGKSELAAAIALLLTCGDGEQRAEVYGCAADCQQASIVFEVSASEDGAPPVAIGFRAKKANSKYRYFWLYRVKFGIPATNLTTKGESIEFSTPSIEGTVIRINKADKLGKHPWKAEISEDDTGVAIDTISGWYTQVYEPSYAE